MLKKLIILALFLFLLFSFALAENSEKPTEVFSYECTVNMGELNEQGGFILKLYSNGFIKHSQLIVGESAPLYTNTYKISTDYISEISNIINNTNIDNIATVLYNGSLDGITNNIGFMGKYYLGTNIKYTSEAEIAELTPQFKENALYENQIIALFNKIAAVFEKTGFVLTLENFSKIN